MRDYMPKRGSLGHDMMFRSTTIQVRPPGCTAQAVLTQACSTPPSSCQLMCDLKDPTRTSGLQSGMAHCGVWIGNLSIVLQCLCAVVFNGMKELLDSPLSSNRNKVPR